MDIMGDIL